MTRWASWLYDLTVHHHAENLKTARAIQKTAHGVQVEEAPYPGSVQGSANTVNYNASGLLKGALLSAALLGGGLGLGKLLSPGAPGDGGTGGNVPPVITKKHDAVQYQQQPDGSWVEVGREPLDYTKPK